MTLFESLSYKPNELSFGTSGLRGLVRDMTDLECYINAKGFLDFLVSEDGLKPGEVVYLAGDLRDSTPRIMDVMTTAIEDSGFKVVNGDKVPTPAIAYYALLQNAPCIMVTGSHIPADRNGIKFYKRAGEVLKDDEAAIHAFVAGVRRRLYEQPAETSAFNADGGLKELAITPAATSSVEDTFLERFTSFFVPDSLVGKTVVVYQQSAVGRDFLVRVIEALGGKAIPIERSETFIPIDTENVGPPEKARFKKFSQDYPDAFAIISTDGDSDRPFVIDETGEFHRGDVLGCVAADYLGARFAAVPVSSNDAVDQFCHGKNIPLVHTRIGSPYVIAAMQTAPAVDSPAVGWEVNGGFLTGSGITLGGRTLKPLPTRDATLPILCALITASKAGYKVSEVFARLPKRYTGGGLIDNVPEDQIIQFRAFGGDQADMSEFADKVFAGSNLGEVDRVDVTDGLRLIFSSGDVVHLRASGNAPQVRVYTNSDSQEHADQLVEKAIKPGGYIPRLLEALV